MDWIDQELEAIRAAGRGRDLSPRPLTGGKFTANGTKSGLSCWLP